MFQFIFLNTKLRTYNADNSYFRRAVKILFKNTKMITIGM